MLSFAKEKEIAIAAAPEAVYDYVSDLARHPEWSYHKLVINNVGGGRFESASVALHLEIKSVLVVETTDRPHRFTFISQDGIDGKYRWHFDISPTAEGSHVKYGLDRLEARLWVKLTQPWLFWNAAGNRGMTGGLANVKRNLEAGAPTRTKASAGLQPPPRQ